MALLTVAQAEIRWSGLGPPDRVTLDPAKSLPLMDVVLKDENGKELAWVEVSVSWGVVGVYRRKGRIIFEGKPIPGRYSGHLTVLPSRYGEALEDVLTRNLMVEEEVEV